MGTREALREVGEVARVTGYLLGAGLLLRLTGRVRPSIPLRALAARAVQLRLCRLVGRSSAVLERVKHERGHAFVARLPLGLGVPSDAEGGSPLVLTEDGRPLGPHLPAFADVVARGEGRWYQWYDALVFSSSDGSDPRTNGRRYVVQVASRYAVQ